MSLKENISMVRDELNAEEKFFENAVKTERFVKKYKTKLIGLAVAAAVIIGANIVYEYIKNSEAEASNAALMILKKDAGNKEALAVLKDKNPNLYDLYMLSTAIEKGDVSKLKELRSSKALAVSDLASYQIASLEKKQADLNSYTNNEDSIYRDMSALQSAVLLMQEKKLDQAHRKLALISSSSPVYPAAMSLMHYGVK
ncbi:hypothetical protein [Sulfurimonas sp. HSL-1716]|uniref:hypothetical protein n=1 Tax=Hydrocurvibacter sulfurireducens TaxID=3131937 RepID=UPI0031F7E255